MKFLPRSKVAALIREGRVSATTPDGQPVPWQRIWRPRKKPHPHDLDAIGALASRRIGSETRQHHYELQARLERQRVCREMDKIP